MFHRSESQVWLGGYEVFRIWRAHLTFNAQYTDNFAVAMIAKARQLVKRLESARMDVSLQVGQNLMKNPGKGSTTTNQKPRLKSYPQILILINLPHPYIKFSLSIIQKIQKVGE